MIQGFWGFGNENSHQGNNCIGYEWQPGAESYGRSHMESGLAKVVLLSFCVLLFGSLALAVEPFVIYGQKGDKSILIAYGKGSAYPVYRPSTVVYPGYGYGYPDYSFPVYNYPYSPYGVSTYGGPYGGYSPVPYGGYGYFGGYGYGYGYGGYGGLDTPRSAQLSSSECGNVTVNTRPVSVSSSGRMPTSVTVSNRDRSTFEVSEVRVADGFGLSATQPIGTKSVPNSRGKDFAFDVLSDGPSSRQMKVFVSGNFSDGTRCTFSDILPGVVDVMVDEGNPRYPENARSFGFDSFAPAKSVSRFVADGEAQKVSQDALSAEAAADAFMLNSWRQTRA